MTRTATGTGSRRGPVMTRVPPRRMSDSGAPMTPDRSSNHHHVRNRHHHGEWVVAMTNAVQNIWRHADQAPSRLALRVGDRTWDFSTLRAQISGAAEQLSDAGVRP